MVCQVMFGVETGNKTKQQPTSATIESLTLLTTIGARAVHKHGGELVALRVEFETSKYARISMAS